MKYAITALFALLLAGCSTEPVAYDQQFSTLDTIDADGVRRSHAWVIGPSLAQQVRFQRAHR
jgi:starvation-inducible outer membrane lipoprotein